MRQPVSLWPSGSRGQTYSEAVDAPRDAEADQTRLEEELAQLRAEQSTGLAALRDLNHQLAELRLDQVRTNDSLTAADRLLDHTLSQDLPAGARQRRVRIEGATKAICSMGSGNYRGLLSRSAISFEKYARRWDWDLILSTEDLAERRPFPWGKIPLLRALMDDYEWLPWVDANVVMVDIEADITREIREDKDLYLVEHHGTEYHANTGVMLLRSSDWSREFLDEVWALGEIYRDHRWWENAAAPVLLGYVLGPHRLVYPTRWLQRTQSSMFDGTAWIYTGPIPQCSSTEASSTSRRGAVRSRGISPACSLERIPSRPAATGPHGRSESSPTLAVLGHCRQSSAERSYRCSSTRWGSPPSARKSEYEKGHSPWETFDFVVVLPERRG